MHKQIFKDTRKIISDIIKLYTNKEYAIKFYRFTILKRKYEDIIFALV